MFSKNEAQQLKQEFWTAFGKSFPRKWLLYDTKIKDFSFKFYADNKKAEVSLDIEMKDELFREAYYDKIWSLEAMLKDEIGDFNKDSTFWKTARSSRASGFQKKMFQSITRKRGVIFSSFSSRKWMVSKGSSMIMKISLKTFSGNICLAKPFFTQPNQNCRS